MICCIMEITTGLFCGVISSTSPRAQGFYGVTIKEISTEISLMRPAIYNYFETKEEILLGLLTIEYGEWCAGLEGLIVSAKNSGSDSNGRVRYL